MTTQTWPKNHDVNQCQAQCTGHQIAGWENAVVDATGEYPTYRGGGHGWTASVKDGSIAAKGTSKLAAVEALAALVSREDIEPIEDDMTEAEEDRCVKECQTSTSNVCACKCGGTNHGALVGRPAYRKAAVYGPKPCQCGCGETTLRQFVPGHDARYHAAQKRDAAAKAAGLSTLEYVAQQAKVKAAARSAKAKARRDARKADLAGQKLAAEVEAIGMETVES